MTAQIADQMPLGTERLLESGDPVPTFALTDQNGATAAPLSDDIAGKPMILLFEGAAESARPAFERELETLRDAKNAWEASNTVVFAITRRSPEENRRLHESFRLPYSVLSDGAGAVFGSYGLDAPPLGGQTVTFVLDANMRAIDVVSGGDPGSHAPRAIGKISALMAEDPGIQLKRHPPVLVVPGALTPEDCARVIQVWNRPVRVWDSDGLICKGYVEEEGDFKIQNVSYGRISQFVLRDPQVQKYLDAKLQRRVLSEIRKAFQTKVSRREDYRIACYDAADGGSLAPHRDNPTPETKHRRFTFSVTLNAGEFAGGALRFPEYGGHEYLVPTGTAVVWSCALLHEVLPVVSGRRFILGTHLFGT
jgi:peroxiredoxin